MSAERMELEDHYVVVNGLRWYARVARRAACDAPAVVLVHGFGISSAYFVPTAERLAATFAVYAPDLPGHGKTATPPAPLDVAGLAEALLEWLAAMHIDKAALVANSMGCQTAAELAVRRPEVVERLVLIGPTLDPKARRLPVLVRRFVAGGVHEDASMTKLLIRDYLRMGTRTFAELRFMLADRIEQKLPRVRAPVLLVRGEHDRIAPLEWLEELERLAPDAEVAVIAGGAHAAHYNAADELVRVVTPFLRGGAPAAAAFEPAPGRGS